MEFRVWDKDFETFVDPASVAIKSDGTLLMDCGGESYTPRDSERFVVDYKTGLHDKNKTAIYERDILDFDSLEWGYGVSPIELVEMRKVIGEYGLCGSAADLSEYRQVIGNSHENPEILKRIVE